MAVAQMTLNLNLRDDAVLENFFSGKQNKQLLKILHAMAHGRGERFAYLWGNKGVGRTHLLQACCQVINQLKLPSFYLSLQDLLNLKSEILQDLESLQLVCLDDVDSIAGNAEWEEAFFGFLNRMHDAKRRLIVAGNLPPARLGIALPDIKSRLSQAMIFQVNALTDDEKIEALRARAKARGLNLSKTVTEFLLRHCPRDMGSLFVALDKLDKASLAAQHKLTIPFVKSVLGL